MKKIWLVSGGVCLAAMLAVVLLVYRAGEDGTSTSGEDQGAEAPGALVAHVQKARLGDLDGMVERGTIRMLTTYSPLYFSPDGLEQRGFAVEVARAFEAHLKESLGETEIPLHVVLVPVARDALLPKLVAGEGDIAAAGLTITPERQKLVAFSDPTYPNVSELLVTGPSAPDIATLDDLAATELHLRESSSYFEHLTRLNQDRKKEGLAEIPAVKADELLEDYDLLELVNAGLIPAVIVDSHRAALWSQVFERIKVHEDLAIHRGGSIAWAVRKNNPKLLEAVNRFVAEAREGTLLGNILIKRYLGSTDWIDSVHSEEARTRFQEVTEFIGRYADLYGFDRRMITAQAYQESKLDQSKVSDAGAVGVMQILPSTAADPNVGIPDIEKIDRNIEAGVKYLSFLKGRYFDSEEISPLNQLLFALAAYNAGPANIARAREAAEPMGFDPNQWFGQVEVAAGKEISREPVTYVRNIYKYYIAYRLAQDIEAQRETASEAQE